MGTPAASEPLRVLRRGLALALGLLVLNSALTFHNLWPTPWITLRGELSVEIGALLLALALFTELRGGTPPARWLAIAVAVLLTVLCLGRYAEVTAPALYGRRINLYWDAQHLPRVTAMLAAAAPAWMNALAVAGVLAVLGAVYTLLAWSVGRVWDALAGPASRRGVGALGAALVLLYGAGALLPRVPTLGWFSLPVLQTYAQQARLIHDAVYGAAVASDLDAAPLPDPRLGAVAGADVVVLFVESYGAIAYDDPELARALEPPRRVLADAIAASGQRAVSALVDSPSFGGASWLAHASLLAGIRIADAASYSALLTRRRDTLVHRFARRGYRAVAVMPGLKRAWPEGSFYGFHRVYGERDLDYRGPAFGWWRIPDQYALAKLDALELRPRHRAPVFAFFPTISTHLPFLPLPPYQPDWHRVLGAQPFIAEEVRASLARTPQWTQPRAAYGDAVAYALRCIAGFVDTPATRDRVLVVLGDHQPAASVSGPGATWEVPVHVVASRPAVLEALLTAGFEPGLSPRRRSLMPMHALAPVLLSAFDGAVATR